MKISEHANYLLNEYGRLQFDYAAYRKPYGEALRNEARNNLETYIAELEGLVDELKRLGGAREMSRTYREFGDLLSAYNEADEKWTPIQKAHELLDSVNEDEIWEQRHAAADALFTYIAELDADNAELKERVAMLDVTAVFKSLGEMGYIEQANKLHTRIAELEAAQRWIPVSERLPEIGIRVLTSDVTGYISTDFIVELDMSLRTFHLQRKLVTHWMPLPKLPEVQE